MYFCMQVCSVPLFKFPQRIPWWRYDKDTICINILIYSYIATVILVLSSSVQDVVFAGNALMLRSRMILFYFADCIFTLYGSTHNSLQACVSLRRYTVTT